MRWLHFKSFKTYRKYLKDDKLKVISRHRVGYDNVHLDTKKEWRINDNSDEMRSLLLNM